MFYALIDSYKHMYIGEDSALFNYSWYRENKLEHTIGMALLMKNYLDCLQRFGSCDKKKYRKTLQDRQTDKSKKLDATGFAFSYMGSDEFVCT